MKGVVEEVLEAVGIKSVKSYDPKAEKNFLHPGRQAKVSVDGTVVGYLGEIHPEVAENYNMKTKAYVAVIDMPTLMELANFAIKYTGIAKYPAVSRDLSMVMPKSILVGQVEELIRKKGGKLLEDCTLFDVYEGDQIAEGHKSVAYSISFRAADHTLEEKEITTVMDKILKGLEDMGIELRK